ncbi:MULTISPECIES: ParB/RepB/Spo0J family partition protein [unclassified Burkholderia]|uniref:ParB/RepB/Spo0J family partition protein n=1 Tax=unclassified Burkholderia TaxID=2613784 RepID=UPI002AB2F3F3|nr:MULTISPECIES: ParB N-terminal domain-containing protein [unclassified Burkholderia]
MASKKSVSEEAFLARMRAQTAGEPGPNGAPAAGQSHGMKLNLPPTGAKRTSLEELLERDAARDGATATPLNGDASEISVPTGTAGHAPADAADLADAGDIFGDFGGLIDLDLIEAHPWNARVHRDPARIREIASDIAATGQERAMSITRHPTKPGHFYIIDGETRYHSLRLLKRTRGWARVQEVDPDNPLEFYRASFKQTNSTEQISSIDQGIKWGRLVAGQFASIEQIAEALEVHFSTVSRMISYSKFPEPVLEFMHRHNEKFTYSVAAVMTPIIDQRVSVDEMLSLCQKIVDEDISRRGIEALLKSTGATDDGAKQTRKVAVITRPVKVGRQPLGGFRSYENGALEFKLKSTTGLAQHTVDALSDILATTSDILSETGGNPDPSQANLVDELIARLQAMKSGAQS